MPRHERLSLSGVPLHVIQRGNNRCACFVDEDDRRLYLGLLQEASRKRNCAVHAFVLMTNHVHLVLTPGEAGAASRLMKHIGERYVRAFNARHRRSGTLWEGRFRSSVIEHHAYLLTCHRYVELNPVRAGMVAHPRDYPWTSYRFNAEEEPSAFLQQHEEYLALGATKLERRTAYARLFRVPLPQDVLKRIREATNAGFALGSVDFLRRLEKELGTKVAPGSGGRPSRQVPAARSGHSVASLPLCETVV